MQEPKYDLNDFSKDETEAFMQDFNELLEKHSAYFEPIPTFVQDKDSQWKVSCQIKLLKKILLVQKQESSEEKKDVAPNS